MRYITKDMGNIDYAYLIPISDLHIGDPHFHHRKFMDLRDWIWQQPNTFVVLVGDIMNCATKRSKSDIYGESMNPTEAKNYAAEMLEPIKDKILGAVWGNHERRIYNESGFDVMEGLADKLHIDYAREGLLLDLKFSPYGEGETRKRGRLNYTCYVTHGNGGGATPGGKINALHKLRKIVLADVYICGHVHGMGSYKDSYFVPNTRAGKIEQITQTYALSSAFLQWGGYSEDMILTPSKLGTSRIRLDGRTRKKDVHVSI